MVLVPYHMPYMVLIIYCSKLSYCGATAGSKALRFILVDLISHEEAEPFEIAIYKNRDPALLVDLFYNQLNNLNLNLRLPLLPRSFKQPSTPRLAQNEAHRHLILRSSPHGYYHLCCSYPREEVSLSPTVNLSGCRRMLNYEHWLF